MTCEEARYLEWEGGEAAAHRETCTVCQEWAADALALRSLAEEPIAMAVPRRKVLARPASRWRIPALLAAAAALLLALWLPRRADLPVRGTTAQPIPIAQTPVAAAPAPATQATRRPKRKTPKPVPGEPIYVRIDTPDPDVVIYWSLETAEGGAFE